MNTSAPAVTAPVETPVVAAPAAAPVATPAPAAPVATDWTTGLSDSHKGLAQNKQWKGVQDVLDSYSGLEKLVGAPQDKLLKIPAEDDVEGWKNVHSRLGRPAQPADYKLEVPQNGDPEFAKWAGGKFHELGLTAKQGEALSKEFNAYAAKLAESQTMASQDQVKKDSEALTKEWGAAHDQNVKAAARAAREFGLDANMIDNLDKAIGHANTMKLLYKIGSKVGETSFVQGETGNNGALTPEQAKQRIQMLTQDPSWAKKYTGGDVGAINEMQRLQQMAFHGEYNL
jgi:hypothetical protein